MLFSKSVARMLQRTTIQILWMFLLLFFTASTNPKKPAMLKACVLIVDEYGDASIPMGSPSVHINNNGFDV